MQSMALLIIGLGITGAGIYISVKHPQKWKNYGIGIAIGGIGINVLNFSASSA